jgi:hypothetical protein
MQELSSEGRKIVDVGASPWGRQRCRGGLLSALELGGKICRLRIFAGERWGIVQR